MNPEEIYDKYAKDEEWSDIHDHLPRLREAAKGNVFEIGVRSGVSTAALLMGVRDHGGDVVSLDINDCHDLYDDPNWRFIRGHSVVDSERILRALTSPLDLLFIDSDHTFPTTLYELQTYGPLVGKDGAILLHDTDHSWGVRAALEEYAKEIGKEATYHKGSFGMGELRP